MLLAERGELMYLSRIFLDTRRAETAKAMVCLSKFHGAVESCFKGERQHALWRIDHSTGKTQLLIVSKDKPDLTNIFSQFGLDGTVPASLLYDTFLNAIAEGKLYRFRIKVNPTVKVKGKRVPMVLCGRALHGDAEGWLCKRLQERGFCDVSAKMVEHRSVSFQSKGSRIEFLAVTFEGIVRISNDVEARKLMTCGLGHEKAFGCGLMTLIPLT